MSAGGAQALCGLHVEVASVATCQRCGRFLCAPCVAQHEPSLCATCLPLWNDPFGIQSTPVVLGAIMRSGLHMVRPVLGPFVFLAVLFSIPSVAISMLLGGQGEQTLREFQNEMRWDRFYEGLMGVVGEVACLFLFISVAEGRELGLGGALREAMSRWARVFGANFRTGLWIILGVLLFVVPAVWWSTMLVFSEVAAVRLRHADALDASRALVRGRFLQVLGYVVAIYAVAVLPGVVIAIAIAMTAEQLGVGGWVSGVIGEALMRSGMYVKTAMLLGYFYALSRESAMPLEPMAWLAELSRRDVHGRTP